MVMEYLWFLTFLTFFGESALIMFCELNGCDSGGGSFEGYGDALPGGVNG